ncbi:hypothetical protein AB0M36_33370 [Actinoplanes sp. NPDC051346]
MVISDITEALAPSVGERAYVGYPIRDVDVAVTGVCRAGHG